MWLITIHIELKWLLQKKMLSKDKSFFTFREQKHYMYRKDFFVVQKTSYRTEELVLICFVQNMTVVSLYKIVYTFEEWNIRVQKEKKKKSYF